MRALMVDASGRGGIATYTALLVDGLRAWGLDVRLCAPDGRSQGAPSLPHYHWGAETASWSRARLHAARLVEAAGGAVALARAIERVRPDVVHVHTRVAPRLDPAVFRLAARVAPLVATAHDAVPLEGGIAAIARQARAWRAVDAVVVHSDAARELVERAAPGRLVTVVPFDLPLPVTRGARRSSRTGLRLPDAPTALLFGLLRPSKGLSLLARSWPAVVAAEPRARLLLVGDAVGELPELATLAGLPGVELRRGFVPEAEVDRWLAAADVLVLPYSSGAHSAVLHRGAWVGTPALASPALGEEVRRLGAGRVVPLEDAAWSEAILAALRSPLPAPRPPRAPSRMIPATVEVYATLAARRRPRRRGAARGTEAGPAVAGTGPAR